jgi:hypothetical protein
VAVATSPLTSSKACGTIAMVITASTAPAATACAAPIRAGGRRPAGRPPISPSAIVRARAIDSGTPSMSSPAAIDCPRAASACADGIVMGCPGAAAWAERRIASRPFRG